MINSEKNCFLFVRKNLIIFTSLPFAPFDKKSFDFLPVFPDNWLYGAGAVAPELIYLVTDRQIIFPGSVARSADRYTYSKWLRSSTRFIPGHISRIQLAVSGSIKTTGSLSLTSEASRINDLRSRGSLDRLADGTALCRQWCSQ